MVNIKQLHPQRMRWLILAVVSIGTFMSTLDSSIVNVALPTLTSTLKTDIATTQWVVTAYLLTITSLLPVFGRVSDMFGRKRVFSIGFLIFILGSVLCGLAPTIWVLIGMRMLQAVGASMLMANSPAIVTAVFPPDERGRALGLVGTVVSLGSLTGPALGGLLVQVASWKYIFFINLPIGLIGFTAARLLLPQDALESEHEPFDFTGAFLFAVGISSFLLAINNGADWGWTSLPVISALVLGLVLLPLFALYEAKVKFPMIDLTLFRNRTFFTGSLAGLLSFVAMFSNVMLMPFYLQHVQGFKPGEVGLLMTSFPLIMAVVAPISGYISDRIGPMILTSVGLIITASGLFYLSFLPSTPIVWYLVIPGPILAGLGAGMFQSPNNASVMSSVPKPKLSLAGGLNALVRNLGMVLGISLSVALLDNRQAHLLNLIPDPTELDKAAAFTTAYHTVMLTAMAIALLAAVISFNRKKHSA